MARAGEAWTLSPNGFRRAGAAGRPFAAIEIEADGTIGSPVGRGLGCSVLPAHAIRRERLNGTLRA